MRMLKSLLICSIAALICFSSFSNVSAYANNKQQELAATCEDVRYVAASTTYTGNICSNEPIVICKNAKVKGNVKSKRGVTLGENAVVTGSVTSDCEEIITGPGSQIGGSTNAPTSPADTAVTQSPTKKRDRHHYTVAPTTRKSRREATTRNSNSNVKTTKPPVTSKPSTTSKPTTSKPRTTSKPTTRTRRIITPTPTIKSTVSPTSKSTLSPTTKSPTVITIPSTFGVVTNSPTSGTTTKKPCVDMTNLVAGSTYNGDICSHAAFTSGANSIINGNVFAAADITLGANSFVYGLVHAVGDVTLGDNAKVSGNVISDTHVITVGQGAKFNTGNGNGNAISLIMKLKQKIDSDEN